MTDGACTDCGAAGDSTAGRSGAVEYWVMRGTAAQPSDGLPAASVAVARKRLAAPAWSGE